MITLRELSWDNCFSYAEHNILNFEDSRLTQILGTNGAGKSSIPLILEEALYNKNSKDVKKADIQNRQSKSGYTIKVVFTKFSDVYEVIVERKSSIKVKLLKNSEDISSHTALNTYKSIESILGMDFRTFSQLIYQSPTSSLQFLTATDTTRKKFLIDLLSLDQYSKLFDVFKEESKLAVTEQSKLEAQLKVVTDRLAVHKDTNLNEMEVPEVPSTNPVLDSQINTLISELSLADKTNSKIIKNNDFISMLKEVDIEDLMKPHPLDLEPTDELQNKLGALNSEFNRITTVLKKLGNVPDNCPTCGQPIDNGINKSLLAEEKSKLEAVKSERAELQASIAAVEIRNNNERKKAEKREIWKNIYRSIDQNLPTELIDIENTQKELEVLSTKSKKLAKDIENAVKAREEAIKHNSKIETIKLEIKDNTELSKNLQNQLSKIREKVADLEVLKKTLSTNGLVAYKIEGSVKELEVIANEYLAELSDGRFTINFTISSDKLNVEVTDNGEVIDINSLSSGELARVNTATLLSIRKLMSSLSKININVLFLDEVIGVLDDAGREKLVETLLNEEDLNTFIVSHNWQHPLLAKLSVVKNNGISRIE